MKEEMVGVIGQKRKGISNGRDERLKALSAKIVRVGEVVTCEKIVVL